MKSEVNRAWDCAFKLNLISFEFGEEGLKLRCSSSFFYEVVKNLLKYFGRLLFESIIKKRFRGWFDFFFLKLEKVSGFA